MSPPKTRFWLWFKSTSKIQGGDLSPWLPPSWTTMQWPIHHGKISPMVTTIHHRHSEGLKMYDSFMPSWLGRFPIWVTSPSVLPPRLGHLYIWVTSSSGSPLHLGHLPIWVAFFGCVTFYLYILCVCQFGQIGPMVRLMKYVKYCMAHGCATRKKPK